MIKKSRIGVKKPAGCLTSEQLAGRWGFNPQSIRTARYLGFNHPKHFNIGRYVFYKKSEIIKFEKQRKKNGTKIIK